LSKTAAPIQAHAHAATEQQARQPAQLAGKEGEAFEDSRSAAITQRRMRALAGSSPQAVQLQAMQRMINKRAAASGGGESALAPVAQRDVAWKEENNHPDDVLDDFADALNTAVQSGATAALTPENLTGVDGYTTLWKTTAPLVMAHRDNAVDPDDVGAAQIARQFAPARYGYAVESYANAQTGALQGGLPAGYTFTIQAGRGMTRPDFVIHDNHAQEVAWFDITSDGSLGHIDKKAGGWKSKTYVAEVTYPALDVDELATSASSIGQRVAARNSAARIRAEWAAHIQTYLGLFQISYGHYKTLSGQTDTKGHRKGWAKDALQVRFYNHLVKDKLAKSLLRALGENPLDYGLDSGGTKAEGDTVLREYLE
jgi:hypothetical protein